MAFPSLSGRLLLSFIFRASNPSFIARATVPVHQNVPVHKTVPVHRTALFVSCPGLCGLLFRWPVRLTTSHPSPDVKYISSLLFLSSLFRRAITLSLKRGFSRSAFHRGTLDAINVLKTNEGKYFNTISMCNLSQMISGS